MILQCCVDTQEGNHASRRDEVIVRIDCTLHATGKCGVLECLPPAYVLRLSPSDTRKKSFNNGKQKITRKKQVVKEEI